MKPNHYQSDDLTPRQSAIVLIIIVLLGLFAGSCRTSGYGCKGKESWKHMERRINLGY